LGLALAAFSYPVSARGHGLVAEYRVLPNQQIQIEAWYVPTRAPAGGAKVNVTGEYLARELQMNEDGVAVFAFEKAEAVRVVVDAGAGHRAVLDIPATALGGLPNVETEPNPVPMAERGARISATDVLAGVGFLLALAAFALAWRNARVISELKKATVRCSVSEGMTDADVVRAQQIWADYQKQHDVSDRKGQAVGIDPKSGRLWFGESMVEISKQLETEGITTALYLLRVGYDYYLRK
jgi:hypothetical protein